MCLCELVACLSAVDRIEEAFAYSQVILRTFMYVRNSKIYQYTYLGR